MYGKFFASTFTGSMYGAGPCVFALWGYVIAHSLDGVVEVNPRMMASVLGTTGEEIEAALKLLCSPDARSRSRAESGRRLVHEGGFQYRVVNHATYRAIRNEEERRAYNREAKRRSRAKNQPSNGASMTINDCQACQPSQSQSQSQSADTEIEKIKITPRASCSAEEENTRRFDAFWDAYPKRVVKAQARKVWDKLNVTDALLDAILKALEAQKHTPQWLKDGKEFIPYPSTWLNQRRWEDEVTTTRPRNAGPDYAQTFDWQAECEHLHSGRCGNAHFHTAKVAAESQS